MCLIPKVGALVAAAALGGCATVPEKAASSEPTSTATSTADPSPTAAAITALPLSRDQAAKRYLEIVRPYNVALEALEKAVNTRKPLARQKALAADVAEELEIEVKRLRATAWPTKVQRHVDDLVTTSEKALKHWRRAARAQTPRKLFQAVVAAGEFDGNGAADKIRKLLDLDSYDEDDYSSARSAGS